MDSILILLILNFISFKINYNRKMEIVHFNDIYNIDERDASGTGAARFRTLLKQHTTDNPLVLFSGDAFSPSDLSTLYKGEQMLE